MSIELSPLIQIVDESDTPLRAGTMDEVQLNGLWHRLARVMVRDTSKDTYLLQMVAPNPYYDGGLWNTTSSGHVDENETYEATAVRETGEEMGIDLTDQTLQEVERYRTEQVKDNGRTYRRHNVTFLVEVNQPPAMNPNDEVEKYTWMSTQDLLSLDESLATSGLKHFIGGLRNRYGN